MKYFSTNRQSPLVDFREAAINGQAPDGGLYFPETVTKHRPEFFQSLQTLSNEEIAITAILPYVSDTIPEDVLARIVAETINFPIPLVPVSERTWALELFHGPTLAFKDIGARFMSRCLGYFLRNETRRVTVLVATSGDTGGAVAHGFHGVEGVEVVILYPSGKVSPVQEKQLTTLGDNIRALEIDGSFDDCQQLVKQAFTDQGLREKLFLTSANSINVARWLPQQFYYFFALKQWHQSAPPVVAVPSGNFGNICAGMLAAASGLPVKHFIAACNANDVIPQFMRSQNYVPKPAIATISNAMDVGNPSNFIRILELFSHHFPALAEKLSAFSVNDSDTRQEIARVYNTDNYLLDPHGAVASVALSQYLDTHKDAHGILLETAHPVKFPEAVEKITGVTIALPTQVAELAHKEKNAVKMNVSYEDFREYLETLK